MLLNEQLSMDIDATLFVTHDGATGCGVEGHWADIGRVDDFTCAHEPREGAHALFLRGPV
jgi:hypothetical protein